MRLLWRSNMKVWERLVSKKWNWCTTFFSVFGMEVWDFFCLFGMVFIFLAFVLRIYVNKKNTWLQNSVLYRYIYLYIYINICTDASMREGEVRVNRKRFQQRFMIILWNSYRMSSRWYRKLCYIWLYLTNTRSVGTWSRGGVTLFCPLEQQQRIFGVSSVGGASMVGPVEDWWWFVVCTFSFWGYVPRHHSFL